MYRELEEDLAICTRRKKTTTFPDVDVEWLCGRWDPGVEEEGWERTRDQRMAGDVGK